MPFLIVAQTKPVTSVEEYNYLTAGYKIQVETGGEFKTGYELQKIDELKANGFITVTSLMKEIATGEIKAVSIVLTKEKDKADKVVYLCLPFNNPELFERFFNDHQNLGLSMKVMMDMTMYFNLSRSFDKIANRCK
jgi:hypothetical protein